MRYINPRFTYLLTYIPALTPAKAGTRLSDPGGMQSWVDLVYPIDIGKKMWKRLKAIMRLLIARGILVLVWWSVAHNRIGVSRLCALRRCRSSLILAAAAAAAAVLLTTRLSVISLTVASQRRFVRVSFVIDCCFVFVDSRREYCGMQRSVCLYTPIC